MKKIKFSAILSGDYECFTFAVTRAVYKQIKGKNPDRYVKNRLHKDLYDIYPGDILFGEEDCLEITIEWEKLGE